MNQIPACSLCNSNAAFFHRNRKRCYYQCDRCRLVFVDPDQWLDQDQEFAQYNYHQNDPSDARYRQHLNRVFEPLHSRLKPKSFGLDFGSGPGPTLSIMFQEAGHEMRIYDPYFSPQRQVLDETYDFVTTTEVVEHFYYPAKEFDLLWSLLRVGGWLAVMTKRIDDVHAFGDWYYQIDPTHVIFFSLKTFTWLAEKWNAHFEVVGPDVVLFQKPCPPSMLPIET